MIDQFTRLADLLELRGDVSEAAVLRRASVRLAEDATGGARQLGGFDARTRWRAEEILQGRASPLLAAAARDLPRDFRRLLGTGLLTASDLVTLKRQLGVLTTGDLALALEGHVLAHRGVPEDLALRARHALEATGADARLTLGRALDAVEPLLALLSALPFVSSASIAGSLRRIEPTVRDLKIVAATPAPEQVWRALEAASETTSVRFHGAAGLTAQSGSHEVNVRLASPDRYGAALLFHTGSREHLALLRRRSAAARLRLAGDGLVGDSGPVPTETEEAAYARLALPFIAPELRLGTDEVQDAAAGTLPRLLERSDIRGDLHVHTSYSDGRDPLDAMVAAAADLGYEYVAITDHSQSAAASRTVSEDDLRRQWDHIDQVQERYPRMRILKGVEADILPDGRLDFPDAVLERLDIVLASLHDPAGHSPERLLKRYQAAARHPLVAILTHPANRLVGRYDGYDLDLDALFETAAATGTVLEIDGAPSHLDLDGSLARRAAESGVALSIDSDCHQARLLARQINLGVGTARRGRVQAAQAINTRSLDALLSRLALKRRGVSA
ncbi:MAG TPA: PHP domain-containing protein [Vicinamibacterales bacterium]|nr:PHP domain-containing protein [Vicinamibacterales bacterium]